MSGVYIPGMKMPENCHDCKFGERYGLVGDYYCHLLKNYFTNNVKPPYKERPSECPLVEVPPHGRLIDADALAEDLDFAVENDQRALDNLDIVGKEREHIQFDKDCKQNCMWYLSNCPTVIPAEETADA